MVEQIEGRKEVGDGREVWGRQKVAGWPTWREWVGGKTLQR